MKLVLVAALCAFAAPAFAMDATLDAPWDGKKVPKGQQCRLHGGTPSTPPISLSGIPAGTVFIIGEFNDRDYPPLSTKGYLAPCSGGRGNRYFVDLKAVDGAGKVLDKVRVEMGRY